MRPYTKKSIITSVVLCIAVIILTITNIPIYKARVSNEKLEKEALLKNVHLLKTTDNLLLNVADSILTSTLKIIAEEDSIDANIKTSLDKLNNINKSINNVRLR